MTQIKPENERRVIHIKDLESEVKDLISQVTNEFNTTLHNCKYKSAGQNSITYLFETRSNAEFFGQLLDLKQVPYSTHPAKDYDKVVTQDMDEISEFKYFATKNSI